MDRAQVESLDRAWEKAVASKDAAAFAALYAEDARLLVPNLEPLEGRAAIQTFAASFVEAYGPVELSTIDVREAGELTVAYGQYVLRQPSGGSNRGKYVVVYEHQNDGSDRLLLDIFNSSLPAPA